MKLDQNNNHASFPNLLLYLLLFGMSLYTDRSKIGTLKSVICCLLRHLLVTY